MPKKIVIIDDDEGILDATKMLLEYEGFEVRATGNVEKGIEYAKDFEPDLILLDLLLSGRDGKEIAQLIRSRDDIKQMPIILMSAHPKVEDYLHDSGITDFIPKPFEIENLLDKINTQLT